MANFKLLTEFNNKQDGGSGGKQIWINIDQIVSIDHNHTSFFEITLTNNKTYQIKGLLDQIIEF